MKLEALYKISLERIKLKIDDLDAEVRNMSKYYQVCASCKGQKHVYNAAWNEYSPQLSSYVKSSDLTVREAMVRLAMEEIRPPYGPEVFLCPTCHGRGVIPTEEGLAILDFLDKMRR